MEEDSRAGRWVLCLRESGGGMYTRLDTCVEVRDQTQVSLLRCLPLFVWDRVFYWPVTLPSRLSGSQQASRYPLVPASLLFITGIRRPRFVHGFWGCKLRYSCLQGSALPWLYSWLVGEGLTKESTVRLKPWRGETELCRYFGTEHSRKKAQCRLRMSPFQTCFEWGREWSWKQRLKTQRGEGVHRQCLALAVGSNSSFSIQDLSGPRDQVGMWQPTKGEGQMRHVNSAYVGILG